MGLKIGITGGIGSGKSTICRIFKILGVPVYDADWHAKDIMMSDPEVVAKLKQTFGEAIYFEDGGLNRESLSEIVFHDKAKLDELNAIVHPAVIQAGKDWADRQTTHYSLKEAALLFESGSYKQLDYTILVTASEEARIKRVIARDNTTVEHVKARMDKQWSDERKLTLADFVIHNDDASSVIKQVLILHEKFLAL